MIRIAWWLSILSIAACAGKLDNKEAFLEAGVPDGGTDNDASACALGNIQTELVDAKCATAGCHSAEAQGSDPEFGGGLALVNADVGGTALAARLVDIESDACAGKKFIDSADVSQSYVLEKLAASPTCGVAMPQIPPLLTEEEIACMQAWAESLAEAQ